MMTRPTTNAVAVSASAHTMEPAQKMPTPMSMTFLRPKLSLNDPLISMRLAKVSAYEPTTHCRSDTPSCNADCTLASTALMTVLSRKVRKRMQSRAVNPRSAKSRRNVDSVASKPALTDQPEPPSSLMLPFTDRGTIPR